MGEVNAIYIKKLLCVFENKVFRKAYEVIRFIHCIPIWLDYELWKRFIETCLGSEGRVEHTYASEGVRNTRTPFIEERRKEKKNENENEEPKFNSELMVTLT